MQLHAGIRASTRPGKRPGQASVRSGGPPRPGTRPLQHAPVFPDVGSMMVSPGFSAPERSASSTMRRLIRSFTLPPALKNSHLATGSQRRVRRGRDPDARHPCGRPQPDPPNAAVGLAFAGAVNRPLHSHPPAQGRTRSSQRGEETESRPGAPLGGCPGATPLQSHTPRTAASPSVTCWACSGQLPIVPSHSRGPASHTPTTPQLADLHTPHRCLTRPPPLGHTLSPGSLHPTCCPWLYQPVGQIFPDGRTPACLLKIHAVCRKGRRCTKRDLRTPGQPMTPRESPPT